MEIKSLLQKLVVLIIQPIKIGYKVQGKLMSFYFKKHNRRKIDYMRIDERI